MNASETGPEGVVQEGSFEAFPVGEAGLPAAGAVLLDVRDHDEARLDGLEISAAIPLPELADRLGEIPPGTVWVHCERGSRAEKAAAVLAAAGRDVVLLRRGPRAARAAGLH